MQQNNISIHQFVLFALLMFCASTLSAQTVTVRAVDLNNRCVELADGGNYQGAIELFRQAIELDQDYALAYAHLGTSLYNTGHREESLNSLKKAIELKPTLAEAYSKLGVVYADLGRNEEAIVALKQAVSIRPDYALAHHNLGCVYIRETNFEEAVSALERSALLDPHYTETFVQLGYALSRLKKYPEAIHQLEQAIRLNSNDAKVQFFLGQLHLLNRDRQSGLAQYRKLVPFDTELSIKLYGLIYGDKVIQVSEK